MKHIITAQQFTTQELAQLFERADALREQTSAAARARLATRHTGRIVATLFYEPSTRTRLSFESAAQRLGMGVISTENAAEFSSAAKGETIEDTIRVVGGYADIIVMRHKETGAAEKAAVVSNVPIINAGDGKGQHPTQSLLDMYTIKRESGRLNGLHVVMGGDLAHGRTVRSLACLLALYPDNRITFVSTPQLRMGDDIKEHLQKEGVPFAETEDFHSSLASADVVYWTRLQKERLTDPKLKDSFVLDDAALKFMKPDAVIMHPLPRINEITASVDADPRAAYFRQAENGLYIRMALMDQLLAGDSDVATPLAHFRATARGTSTQRSRKGASASARQAV